MKILLTGGGSGGHFYPVIAVAEEINRIVDNEHLLDVNLYYMSDKPYNEALLFSNDIIFKRVKAGKMRRYFSLLNLMDTVKTGIGILEAILKIFSLFPDVVFSKGGYASFPALLAAKIFRIPVIIHESDTVPGRVNAWSAKFAFRIAISYPEAAKYFPEKKVAFTGNPIRKSIMKPTTDRPHEYFGLDKTIPTILVLGGSQGAEIVNDVVLEALPDLLKKYQIIHQTGRTQYEKVKETAKVIMGIDNPALNRYKAVNYLDELATRTAVGASTLIITRAGSVLFEIALWGKPSIIIPITDSNGDHQRQNAYSYARKTGAIVIEEANVSGHLLMSEVDRIITDPAKIERMQKGALSFATPDAAEKIAREIVNIALHHEL